MNARLSVAPIVAVVGCGALAARFALVAATPRPGVLLVAFFGLLLACGMFLPVPATSAGTVPAIVVVSVGIAAFAVGRVLVGGHAPLPASGYAVATSTLAAVAEEAWFRRLCFGLLAPAGPRFALAASTVLFAVVHVVIYGWWVFPLDLAAGALLGWQRLASGSWIAPAVTHVIANTLVLL